MTLPGTQIKGDRLALLCERLAIPLATVHRAFVEGAEIIITGRPDRQHNCDMMGCGQAHVIRRITR